jgi:hypothetical protein
MRRLFSGTERVVPVNWFLSQAHMTVFDDWFETTLKVGNEFFSLQVKDQGARGLLWWKAKWVAPYQASAVPGGYWKVSGNVRLFGQGSVIGPDVSELKASFLVDLSGSAIPTIDVGLELEILVGLTVQEGLGNVDFIAGLTQEAFNKNISVPAGAIAVSGAAPSLAASSSVVSTPGSGSMTIHVPDNIVRPGALTVSGQAPNAVVATSGTVLPAAAALTISGSAPTAVATSDPMPLDGFTTGLWSAISTRRLLTSYTGALMTVRRSSDSATQDIGYLSDGSLDTTSLASFVGANSATVSTWKSQSGVSGTQFLSSIGAGPNGEPAIVTSGSYLGHVEFDGADDIQGSNSNSDAGLSAHTVFFKGYLRSTSSVQVILELTNNINSNHGAIIYADSTTLVSAISQPSGAGNARRDCTPGIGSLGLIAVRFDRSKSTADDEVKVFFNGTMQTTSDNSSGSLPSGNFDSGAWRLGARFGPTVLGQLNAYELVIYDTALSDGDIAAISAALA